MTLEDLDKKEKVKQWLEKRMEDPICSGLDFGAYLIMPIQRATYLSQLPLSLFCIIFHFTF